MAVIRNNKPEVGRIPIQENEDLNELKGISEHTEIYDIIKSRENFSIDNATTFENILDDLRCGKMSYNLLFNEDDYRD